MKTQSKNKKSSARRTAKGVGSGRLVGVWNRWKSRWAEYRRKKAEDDRMWDYWLAKDAYERGELTFEQFFYNERFFPGWKSAIEKKKAEQADPNNAVSHGPAGPLALKTGSASEIE